MPGMGIGHEYRFPVFPNRLEAGVGVNDVDAHVSPPNTDHTFGRFHFMGK